MSAFCEKYEVLEATIQSIVTSNYDNNKLLLFVVCDGIQSDTNSGSINKILKIFGIKKKPLMRNQLCIVLLEGVDVR
jgi:hypothetical protein